MIVSLHPAADEELIAGARYYAVHTPRTVAEDFLDAFDSAVALLKEHPGLGTPWRGKKRFPLRRFPYSVIYQELPGGLRIVAIAHQRRKPGYWLNRR